MHLEIASGIRLVCLNGTGVNCFGLQGPDQTSCGSDAQRQSEAKKNKCEVPGNSLVFSSGRCIVSKLPLPSDFASFVSVYDPESVGEAANRCADHESKKEESEEVATGTSRAVRIGPGLAAKLQSIGEQAGSWKLSQ